MPSPDRLKPPIITHDYRPEDAYQGNCYLEEENRLVVGPEHLNDHLMDLLRLQYEPFGYVISDEEVESHQIFSLWEDLACQHPAWMVLALHRFYQDKHPDIPFYFPFSIEQVTELMKNPWRAAKHKFPKSFIDDLKSDQKRHESGVGRWTFEGNFSEELRDMGQTMIRELVETFNVDKQTIITRAHEWIHYVQARRRFARQKQLEVVKKLAKELWRVKDKGKIEETVKKYRILDLSHKVYKEMEAIIIELRTAERIDDLRWSIFSRLLPLVNFYKGYVETGVLSVFEHYSQRGELYLLPSSGHDMAVMSLLSFLDSNELFNTPSSELPFLSEKMSSENSFGPKANKKRIEKVMEDNATLKTVIWNNDILKWLRTQQEKCVRELCDLQEPLQESVK